MTEKIQLDNGAPLDVKHRAGALVVARGPRGVGWAVYHARLDGSKAVRVPTSRPGKNPTRCEAGDLADPKTGFSGVFRTLAPAKRFAGAVATSGTLPTHRPATKTDVQRFAAWLDGDA
jgi:hypothetical protein